MPKYQKFFNEVTTLRSNLRGLGTFFAKEVIGDSTNNNRTLTVNQTIRFLRLTGQIKLSNQILAAYNALKPYIVTARLVSGRTDAVDINEFVTVYRQVVMTGKINRQEIGQVLSKVG